jgi:hypothetical protein
MGYQNVASAIREKSWRLSALGAAVAVGLGIGFAAPVTTASAGIASGGETSSTKPAKDTDGMIVVADKHKNKNWNNKHWNNKKVVVVRPYRKWYKRPYYGTVIGGVALGTVLGAAAYNAVAPAPNLCWYWADPTQTQGYWDYCN